PELDIWRWCAHADAEGDSAGAERVRDDWARQLAEAGVWERRPPRRGRPPPQPRPRRDQLSESSGPPGMRPPVDRAQTDPARNVPKQLARLPSAGRPMTNSTAPLRAGRQQRPVSSQQVSWWDVHEYVAPFLEAVGDWPPAGSPAWCQLADD